MSNPRLPPELLDHVIDLLHDTKHTLKECSLVSRSWIPRTRKHLFASIKIKTEAELNSWREMFPDPSTSLARHAETLIVGCSHIVAAADAEVDGWIRGFSHVERMELTGKGVYLDGSAISLLPFHGFSSAMKSLRVELDIIPSLEVFNLILSLPRLEDLAVLGFHSIDDEGIPATVRPSSSPIVTATFLGGMKHIIRRFLSLPGGVDFRKLTLLWNQEQDLPLTMSLVEGCSHTLEDLTINSIPFGAPI